MRLKQRIILHSLILPILSNQSGPQRIQVLSLVGCPIKKSCKILRLFLCILALRKDDMTVDPKLFSLTVLRKSRAVSAVFRVRLHLLVKLLSLFLTEKHNQRIVEIRKIFFSDAAEQIFDNALRILLFGQHFLACFSFISAFFG